MNKASGKRVHYSIRSGQGVVLALALTLFPLGQAIADEPASQPAQPASTLLPGAEDGFVDSGGVKIHYVSLGRKEDPLVLLIHGFPDFWYSWRLRCPSSRNTSTS